MHISGKAPMPGDVFLSMGRLETGRETMQKREYVQRVNMSVLLIFQDHKINVKARWLDKWMNAQWPMRVGYRRQMGQ